MLGKYGRLDATSLLAGFILVSHQSFGVFDAYPCIGSKGGTASLLRVGIKVSILNTSISR